MKCNNKEAFEQQNVFGTGMPTTPTPSILSDSPF